MDGTTQVIWAILVLVTLVSLAFSAGILIALKITMHPRNPYGPYHGPPGSLF